NAEAPEVPPVPGVERMTHSRGARPRPEPADATETVACPRLVSVTKSRYPCQSGGPMHIRQRFLLGAIAFAGAAGCAGGLGPAIGGGDAAAPAQGTAGTQCFPNGTCFSNLSCVAGTCVSENAIDGGLVYIDGGVREIDG